MQQLDKTWFNIFDYRPSTGKIRGINFKEASLIVVPLFIIVIIAVMLLVQWSMPGQSSLQYALISISIAIGLLLYLGGLIISIFAFKKAHDLFQNPDKNWRESVVA